MDEQNPYALETTPSEDLSLDAADQVPAHRSRGDAAPLSGSSKRYLARLQRGLGLVTGGIALAILSVAAIIIVAVGTTVSPGAAPMLGVGFFFAMLASVMISVGWWLFSTPEPGRHGDGTVRGARVALRVSVLVGVAISVTMFLCCVPSVPQGSTAVPQPGVFDQALRYAASINNAVMVFVSMIGVRWIAERVPDPLGAKRAKRFMWLGSLLIFPGMFLIVGPLISLVMYWNQIDRLRKQIKTVRIQRGDINAKAPKIPR